MGHDKAHALDSADHTAPAGSVALNSQKITGLADPTAAQDAATKTYVDAVATGLDLKASCRLATNAALPFGVAVYANGSSGVGATLTGFGFGALTVDGVTAAIGDRILVKDQATHAHHGIYTVTVTGGVATLFVLTRATDFDQAAELAEGDFTFIEEGTANAHQGWVLTSSGPFTMGTTSLDFSQFSAAGEYVAGTGISISGTTIAVSDSSSTPAAVGTASAGTTTNAPSASNHVHATGAGTPTTQAIADAAATGSGPAAAMTDHLHAMPSAVQALTSLKHLAYNLVDLTKPTPAFRVAFPRGFTKYENGSVLTAQTLRLVAMGFFANEVVSSITFVSATTGFTAGATTNNKWFCILDSTFKSYAFTSDDGSTAWGGSAAKTLSIAQTSSSAGGSLSANSTWTVPSTGLYYIGIMIAPVGSGAVVPTLSAISSFGGAVHNLSPILGGNSTTLMTSVVLQNPATTPASTAGLLPYCYVS